MRGNCLSQGFPAAQRATGVLCPALNGFSGGGALHKRTWVPMCYSFKGNSSLVSFHSTHSPHSMAGPPPPLCCTQSHDSSFPQALLASGSGLMNQTRISPGCLQWPHILSVMGLLVAPLDAPAYVWVPLTENLRILYFPENSSVLMQMDNNDGIGGRVGAATSCAVTPLGHLCAVIGWTEQSV